MATRICPKCRGLMYLEPGEYEEDWACLNCGKRMSLEEMEELMKDITCTHCGQTAPLNERIQHSPDCPLAEANSIKEPEVASSSTRPPVPPKPETTNYRKIHAYYLQNRQAILRDLSELGQKKTLERWGIKSSSTMHFIRHGWKGRKSKERPVSKAERSQSIPESPKSPSDTKVSKGDRYIYLGTFTVVAADGLPSFPEFDSSWPEMVQLRWLDVYRDLARSK